MDDRSVAKRLQLALDMFELGERMQAQRLRRAEPDAGDAEIAAELSVWRRSRPGAPSGDCPGKPSRRFQ